MTNEDSGKFVNSYELPKQDVQYIARLARIELTPEEEEKFVRDLPGILGFVEEINQINTDNIEPITCGTLLENVMQEDEILHGDMQGKSDILLNAAPDKIDRYIKVKAVFE